MSWNKQAPELDVTGRKDNMVTDKPVRNQWQIPLSVKSFLLSDERSNIRLYLSQG